MNTVGNITKYDGVMIHNPFCKRSFDTFQQKKWTVLEETRYKKSEPLDLHVRLIVDVGELYD